MTEPKQCKTIQYFVSCILKDVEGRAFYSIPK